MSVAIIKSEFLLRVAKANQHGLVWWSNHDCTYFPRLNTWEADLFQLVFHTYHWEQTNILHHGESESVISYVYYFSNIKIRLTCRQLQSIVCEVSLSHGASKLPYTFINIPLTWYFWAPMTAVTVHAFLPISTPKTVDWESVTGSQHSVKGICPVVWGVVIACPGVGDVDVENDEVTRAGALTAGKDSILSLINFLSLSPHLGFQQYCQSLFHHHHSDHWRHHLVACLVL